jgi:hypothetical protein
VQRQALLLPDGAQLAAERFRVVAHPASSFFAGPRDLAATQNAPDRYGE